MKNNESIKSTLNNETKSIAFGAGCFWCVEGVFSSVVGVLSTQIGYGGGRYPNPTYTSVSSDPSGHAELTIVRYDPKIIGLDQLIHVFLEIHDPNKQYTINDKKGELYRSVIMYNSETQRDNIYSHLSTYQKLQGKIITTEVLPLINYKSAEVKYQNYYSSNPEKPFCKNVIGPKIAKLRAKGII